MDINGGSNIDLYFLPTKMGRVFKLECAESDSAVQTTRASLSKLHLWQSQSRFKSNCISRIPKTDKPA